MNAPHLQRLRVKGPEGKRPERVRGRRILTGWIVLASAGLLASPLASPMAGPMAGSMAMAQGTGDASGGPSASAPLSAYLRAAELRNPGIAAAHELSRAAREEPDVAGAWPEPQASYAHFIETLETRVGPQEYRVGLAQRIPWFGSLGAARSAAEARADGTAAREDAARQQLFHDVKRRYYELYFTGKAIDVIEQQVTLLDQLVDVARTRYTAGRGSQTALLRLQMRTQQLEDALAQRRDEWTSHLARMDALLGEGGPGGMNGSPGVAFALPPIDYAVLLQSLDTVSPRTNPELETIAAHERESEALLRLAEKRTYPDFQLGVQYLATGEAADPTMPESGKDPWLLSVSMELPLWWGQHRAAREQARAQRRARQLEWEDAANRLAAEVLEVRNRLQAQQRSIDLLESSLLPLAEQATEVTVRDYAGGRVTYVEVIDAQQAQLELELDLARAQADRGQSLAHLERLLGRPLDDAHASHAPNGE